MRRGFAQWLTGKLGILVFAAVVFAAFMYYAVFQQAFTQLDATHKSAESLARFADSVCASPVPLQAEYEVRDANAITVASNGSLYYVTVTNGANTASKALHCASQAVSISHGGNITVSKQGSRVVFA